MDYYTIYIYLFRMVINHADVCECVCIRNVTLDASKIIKTTVTREYG